MNEADTRAELIEPKLREAGWGVVPETRVRREYRITKGRIQPGGRRLRPLIADYVLEYQGVKLAVLEAKSDEKSAAEGVQQAKDYAAKMHLPYALSSNGREIYLVDMRSGQEREISRFPTPEEMAAEVELFRNPEFLAFVKEPFHTKGGMWEPRYYQEIAVSRVLKAIADGRKRVLLTLATGTGKTAIAFQIAWKLFQRRWNLSGHNRRPRILFLADRNILADQAYNAFSAFPEDAMVRIKPDEIRRRGHIPTNGNIFFTIYQTFMSGTDEEGNPKPYFGDYPPDFFDLIIVDECHRGGANDESAWRQILEYFDPAVQLGLTATPKRDVNADTYKYFGHPVYVYSLKEGINDGFLTPFKVKRIQTTLDEYTYSPEDTVLEGYIDPYKTYTEKDFNRIIQIRDREAKRVKIFMDDINQNEKTLVFCRDQNHAALIRDLINQYKTSKDPNYCVRVTADDGERGEEFLRMFQDNEKSIPTILTTSRKLSTGVDARNVRNIVLLRPVNSMVEFKQIIGRGTRIYKGKDFFTIYDFVGASKKFSDPEWDGDPVGPVDIIRPEPNPPVVKEPEPIIDPDGPGLPDDHLPKLVKIKLGGNKLREFQFMVSTSFYSPEGKPISAKEFIERLYGTLPSLFENEEQLRRIWSNPQTRKQLLEQLEQQGFSLSQLETLKKIIDAENSDVFDVLEFIMNADYEPVSRKERAEKAKEKFIPFLNKHEREFIEFVLDKYVEKGIRELSEEKLGALLKAKYGTLNDALQKLGDPEHVLKIFSQLQEKLYEGKTA